MAKNNFTTGVNNVPLGNNAVPLGKVGGMVVNPMLNPREIIDVANPHDAKNAKPAGYRTGWSPDPSAKVMGRSGNKAPENKAAPVLRINDSTRTKYDAFNPRGAGGNAAAAVPVVSEGAPAGGAAAPPKRGGGERGGGGGPASVQKLEQKTAPRPLGNKKSCNVSSRGGGEEVLESSEEESSEEEKRRPRGGKKRGRGRRGEVYI